MRVFRLGGGLEVSSRVKKRQAGLTDLDGAAGRAALKWKASAPWKAFW